MSAMSHRRSFRRNAVALATATVLGPVSTLSAQAAVCTWLPTSGNWAAIANWASCITGTGTPGSADTANIGATGIVTVNSAQQIAVLNQAGSLIVDGSSLRVTGGINGNGTTTIRGGGLLNLENTQTVGGNATIVFGSGGNNRVGVDGGSKVVTLAAGTTIRGANGSIGLGQLINGSGNSVVNQGLISSDSGGTISILQSGLTNQGIAEATGAGSVLSLQSSVNNTGGTLRSTAGGVVRQEGVTVTGGTISNASGGSYQLSNSGSNVLSVVTLAANSFIDMATATSTGRVNSGMTLNGTINLNNSSLLNFEGDQVLGGSGTIVFGATGNNRVGIDGGSKTLTVASGVTIRGDTGSIGLGQLVNGSGNALVNNGTIAANVNGGVITLLGLGAGITNNGTIRADNGGTIALQSNLTGGVGSQLAAGAGSVISQQAVTISGIVNTTGTGSVRPTNSGSNYLSGVTLTGTLDMATATSTERVVNNLTLNGVINLDNSSLLNFEGDQTITGNGTIVFGVTGNNRVGVDGGSKTLTIDSGVTIRGQNGSIGLGQLVNGSGNSVINNGTISADVAGGVVTILQSPVTNNGTIRALNGGTLQLQSNLAGSAGGQLVAGAGSVISQQGVTISGVINTSGSGNLRPTNSGSNYLSGVTLNGSLDMASASATERVSNNLSLNGTINVDNGSLLNFEGNQTLSGNGTIVFGATGNNRVGVDGGSKTLTLASGVTIRGENGSIGLGQLINGSGNTLVNQGLISSDSGGLINLSQSTFVNQSFAEAVGTGSVLRLDTTVDNSAGTLRSSASGLVLQNAVAVTGGSISNTTGGLYQLTNSGSNYLDGVTLTAGSTIDMASASATGRVINGMVLNGTLNLNNGSLISMQGDQTLSGTGAIVFGAVGNNRVGVDGGGKTLTIASGTTIRGTNGTIGIGQLVNGSGNGIINNGTINSDGGGTLTIQSLDAGIVSNGRLRAQSGILNVSTALSGTGTLQVDAGGTMNLAAGAKTQDVLTMGAAGAALNLSTGNLTLSGDYTNGAWGSGNTFSRRAGITGTGLILAGGNAAQSITGAGVTNGATTSATLTLGNVRVGGTTFNYQVANTGTTGPTLRGAIQTSVNGASLTDSRLSGAGVTASNYSAGAPGSNSGNLGVTLTVGTAGVLAPLTVQVLNLRSNFENIADQKLNIVLGAGAAAYNAAVGSAATPIVVAAQRVGGSNTASVGVSNTSASGSFSEDLNASFSGFTGGISGSGSVAGLVAGGNSTALSVGVNTATSGAKSGTASLQYQTTGTVGGVSNGLGVAGAGSQTVNVSGNVYAPAVAQVAPGVSFGIVRVGDVVGARGVSVANTASGALTDTLRATIASSSTPFSATGTAAGVAAGGSSANAMTVSLNTAVAGVYSGSALVTLTSQNPEMADLALGTSTVSLSAQVNNLAKAGLSKTGAGTFSGAGNVYTLDFGSILPSATGGTAVLSLGNIAAGPADALAGAFDLSALQAGDPFLLNGFNSFAGLSAGSAINGLSVAFGGSTVGNFDRTVTVSLLSTNGSGPDLGLTSVQLHLIGSVAAVPEPGTWALWLGGLGVMGMLARRRAQPATRA